jgi:hypothetical protein
MIQALRVILIHTALASDDQGHRSLLGAYMSSHNTCQ